MGGRGPSSRVRRTDGPRHRQRWIATSSCPGADGGSAGPCAAGSPALRPFRAALSRVLPGIVAEEPIAATIDPTVVLGEGALRLLRSVGGSGTLLLLEDLHWADPDTVALLDSLGGALSTSPIIVSPRVSANRYLRQTGSLLSLSQPMCQTPERPARWSAYGPPRTRPG